MKYLNHAAVVGVALVAAGCASAPGGGASTSSAARSGAQHRQKLFGWWMERRSIDHGKVVRLTLRCPDGVYLSDVRTLGADGKLRHESQTVGDWGVSGPVYFTIEHERYRGGKHEKVDLRKERYYNAYRILALSYTSFRYRAYADGTVLNAHRASPDDIAELGQQPGAMTLPSSCNGGDSDD